MDNPGLKRLNTSDPKTAIRVVQRRTADYSGSPTTVYDNAQGQPRTQNSDSPGTDSVTPYEQMQHNVDVQVGPPASGVVTPSPASAANGAQPAISDQAQKDLAARRQPGQGASPTNPAWVDAQQQIRQRQQTEQSMRGAHPLFQPRVSAFDEGRGEWLYNLDDPDYFEEDAAPSIHDHTNQPMFNVVQQYYHHPEDLDENDMLHPETESFWGLGTRYEEDGDSRRYRDQIAREGSAPERPTWDMLDERPEGLDLRDWYRDHGFQVGEDRTNNFALIREPHGAPDNPHGRDNPSHRGLIGVYPQQYIEHDPSDDTADPSVGGVDEGNTIGSAHDPEDEPCSTCWVRGASLVSKRNHNYYVGLPHKWRGFENPEQGMGRFGAFDEGRQEFLYDIDNPKNPRYWLADPPPSLHTNTKQPMYQDKKIPYEEPGYDSYTENDHGFLTSQPRWEESWHHTGWPACAGCRRNGYRESMSPDHEVHDMDPSLPPDERLGHHHHEPIEDLPSGERLAAYDPQRREWVYNISEESGDPHYYQSDPPPSWLSDSAAPMYTLKHPDNYTYEDDNGEEDMPYPEEDPEGYANNRQVIMDHPQFHPNYRPCRGCMDLSEAWNSQAPDAAIHTRGSKLYHHNYQPVEDTKPGERLAAYDRQRKEFLYDIDEPDYFNQDFPPSAWSDSAQPMFQLKEPDLYNSDDGSSHYPREDANGYAQDALLDHARWEHPPFRVCRHCADDEDRNAAQYPPDEEIHKPGSPFFEHPYSPVRDTKPGERL